MIAEKIKQVHWRKVHKYPIGFMMSKAILILVLLSGGLAYGQNGGSDWSPISPVDYQLLIEIPGIGKVKYEVRMHYYLLKGGVKYYRKANKSNQKFDLNINENDKFKVRIEFRTREGEKGIDDLFLVVPSSQWVSSTECIKKSKDFTKDMSVYQDGHKELIFNLKPGCDKLSEITIEFKFVKDSKDLEFKISKPNEEKIRGKNKKARANVTIPIKVGYSNKSIKNAKNALTNATKASTAGKKALDEAIEAGKKVEQSKEQALRAKTKDEAVKASNEVTEAVKELEKAANEAEKEASKAEQAVTEVEKAVKAAKGEAAKKETKEIAAKVGAKAEEADGYAVEAKFKLVNATKIAAASLKVVSPVINNAEWLKEIEEKVSNQDMLTQIKNLETRMKNENNPVKRTLLNNTIIDKVKRFFNQSILTAGACSKTVKDFGETANYKEYLSQPLKEKYKNHLDSCKNRPLPPPVVDIKKPQTDSQAFAAAETTNTIKAYNVYISNFSKGKKVGKAKKSIKDIREKDEKAWQKALAAITDDPCANVKVFETYLEDTKHHTKYRQEAKKARSEASKNCLDFRIESKTQNGPEGVYTFEIKKGNAPYKITPINNDGAVLNLNNEIITLTILKKGDYEIEVTDNSGAATSYPLDAQHPDLKISEQEGVLIIAGGQSPFDLFVKKSNRVHHLDGRSIKKEVLINNLGLQQNFYLQAIDNYNVKSKEIFIKSDGSGEDSLLGSFFILAGILLTGTILYFRNKIPFLKDLKIPGKLSEEDRIWKTAEERKTLEYYNIYKEKYPEGKYAVKMLFREKELKEWESCKNTGDHTLYLQKYPEGLFSEEASKILSAPPVSNVRQASANPKEGQPIPSNIDFYIDGNATLNVQSSNATLPSFSNDEYFQFDLNKHWGNTAVQSVWMSREACLEAYYLIEDAIKTAFQKDETIPEVGGFLLGIVHPKNSGSFDLQIEKFISVTPENNGEYEVSFGQEAFMELSDAYDANPELKLMGWMHTHPGHGLFLSGKDQIVVNQYFKESYQVSMEVETKTRNLDTAFFSRKNDKSLNNTTTDKKQADWFHWEDVKYWLKTISDSTNKLN